MATFNNKIEYNYVVSTTGLVIPFNDIKQVGTKVFDSVEGMIFNMSNENTYSSYNCLYVMTNSDQVYVIDFSMEFNRRSPYSQSDMHSFLECYAMHKNNTCNIPQNVV